jgi:hypothetical protein
MHILGIRPLNTRPVAIFPLKGLSFLRSTTLIVTHLPGQILPPVPLPTLYHRTPAKFTKGTALTNRLLPNSGQTPVTKILPIPVAFLLARAELLGQLGFI